MHINIFIILGIAEIVLAVFVGGHALLYKRDPRSSIFWILLILLVPWLGILLYLVFGINRIRRGAPLLTTGTKQLRHSSPDNLANLFLPFRSSREFEALKNGDEAYPRMLVAIDAATKEILLSNYIFDFDRVGAQFVDRLKSAVSRGVSVYVLLDGLGIGYSFPRITGKLKQAGVPYAVFLPTFIPWSTRFLNLRNHRKLLVVDRAHAFIGGLNIREGHCLALLPRSPILDIHFSLRGEVINDFVIQFAQDWEFASKGATLEWHVEQASDQSSSSIQNANLQIRSLSDGPDLSIPRFSSLLLIRIAEAKSRLKIVSPYFLLDRVFISALTTAALRGVEIDVIVPAKNNLPWMRWAMHAQAWQLLEYGVRIWETQGHFDHSKIFVVDCRHTIVGSSNWDSRSFRLNFELNIEVDSVAEASKLEAIVSEKQENARSLTIEALNKRSLALKLRDATARLFLPIL